ncbi:hypothetical protein LP416_23540 [Polaromonas sp. P2-4]|nr:hypothetical protein LP416_23540 [Polaromonas sp. P2-4]
MNKLISLLVLSIFSMPSFANDGYKCQVEFAYTLKDSGEFLQSNFAKFVVGKEFVVDKGTGRITGVLSNHNASGQPVVVDYGSSKNAYKAITIYKPNAHVDYLYIQSFNDNAKKPFMFVDGSETYSGKCVLY